MHSRRARVIFTQRQQNGSHQRKAAQEILVAGACFAICVLTARAGLAAEAIESCVASGGNFNPAALKHDEKIRQFEFEYASKAVGLKPGANVRVWLPIPPTNQHQSVSVKAAKFPAKATTARESQYGNCMVYFETVAPPMAKSVFRWFST